MNKNKLLIWFLVCVMLILQIPISAFAQAETLDLQKDGNWYLINTAEDLYKFADYVNTTYKANYSAGTEKSIKGKLTADIDLNPGVEFFYDETTGKIKVEKKKPPISVRDCAAQRAANGKAITSSLQSGIP